MAEIGTRAHRRICLDCDRQWPASMKIPTCPACGGMTYYHDPDDEPDPPMFSDLIRAKLEAEGWLEEDR